MTQRAGTTASGLLISAGTLVVLAVLFLFAELLVRVIDDERCAKVRHDGERIATSRRYLVPCREPERSAGEEFLVPVSGEDSRPVRLSRRRRTGVARIAVVGESSASLLANQLADRVQTPACDGRVEVLNCAQPGSGLEHVERRFDEVIEYDPDVVVLLFGHNIHFRFELDEEKLRSQAMRARSCILSQLAPVAAEPPTDLPSLENRLDALGVFLRRAAAATRSKGIVLAVATMPGNLRVPPGGAPGDEYNPRFLDAQFLAARGQRDEAIRVLEALAAETNEPYWYYQLGEQLARAGDEGRAYEELHRALDADHLGMRAPGRLNDLLRRVAAEEKLLLRDTERAVESHSSGGVPGWDSFSDNCHLLPSAIDREIDGLLALLQETVRLPPACQKKSSERFRKGLGDVLRGVFHLSVSGPADIARGWYQALALAVESWVDRDPERADHDVTEFLAGPTFAPVRGDQRGAGFLVALAEGYFQAGHRDRARELNQQARDTGSAEAWVQRGLFFVQQDKPQEARVAFEQALVQDRSREDARHFSRLLSSSSN
jgi:tetratricopeptide (TPR) repeat protein